MRSKIVGQALVITLDTALADLKRAAKYAPKALCLYAEDDEGHTAERFKVMVVDKPVTGELNKFGAVIGACDSQGKAQITLPLQNIKTEERKFKVTEMYAAMMVDLAEVEENVARKLEVINSRIASVIENMEVE